MRWGVFSRRDYHVLRSSFYSLWMGELGLAGSYE